MIIRLFVVLLGVLLLLGGCGKSEATGKGKGKGGKAATATSAPAKGLPAIPKEPEILTSEDERAEPGTNWQLADDSVLYAITDPWPAKRGTAKLKAKLTPDDADHAFAGKLKFRLVPKGEAAPEWQPFPAPKADGKTTLFEAPIKLPKGQVTIEFSVQDAGDNFPTVLKDWVVIPQ